MKNNMYTVLFLLTMISGVVFCSDDGNWHGDDVRSHSSATSQGSAEQRFESEQNARKQIFAELFSHLRCGPKMIGHIKRCCGFEDWGQFEHVFARKAKRAHELYMIYKKTPALSASEFYTLLELISDEQYVKINEKLKEINQTEQGVYLMVSLHWLT